MGFNRDIYTKWAVLEESLRALYRCKMSVTWSLSQQMQVGGSRDGNACEYGTLTSWEREKKSGSIVFLSGILLVAVHFLSFLASSWNNTFNLEPEGVFPAKLRRLSLILLHWVRNQTSFLHYFNLKPNIFFPSCGLTQPHEEQKAEPCPTPPTAQA